MARLNKVKAFAKIELGLSSEEFYNMTPADLADYIDVWENREMRKDVMNALGPTMLANTNRDPKKNHKPFEVHEFMMFFGNKVKNRNSQKTAHSIESYFANKGIKIEDTKNG